MPEFLAPSLSWPTWPATIMLIGVCGYWLLVIFGAMTADALDFSFDLDGDPDGSILDLGFVVLRFFNLGRVPLMLWVSVLALAYWIVSRVMESQFGIPKAHPEFDIVSDGNATLRDIAIAVFATKFMTNPFRGVFENIHPLAATDLIGRTCIVTAAIEDKRVGEAQVSRNGAPLNISASNVEEGEIPRGESAEIVGYLADNNVYQIRRTNKKE